MLVGMTRPVDPCAIVIFGSTGDLAQKKLLPALFALERHGKLPAGCTMVGFARGETTDDALRARYREALSAQSGFDAPAWDGFARGLFAVRGDYADLSSFETLKSRLDELDRAHGTRGNRLFYLAVPPSAYADIVGSLGRVGLVPRGSGDAPAGWSRVIIEKPFGHDLGSAQALNDAISVVLSENQIYRIDHYLGKETVQNIIVLRFGNGIFEPLWNRRYIDRVQITVAETIGIGNRGRFYEQAGALRDIVQNHLLQLLALVAMEPPVAFDADDVRDETVKALKAIRPLTPGDIATSVVRGQYAQAVIGGQKVPGYRQEANVAPDSTTETFMAMKLTIENWRWAGVPFYVRAGKRLGRHVTEVAIRYRRIPHLLFPGLDGDQSRPNELVLRIQPDEGISLSFGAKAPGAEMEIRPVTMDFSYSKAFGVEPTPAYERLLLDAIKGDASLFIRSDAVRTTWQVVQPVLDAWKAAGKTPLPQYPAGTWGPAEADALMTRDGRKWRNPV